MSLRARITSRRDTFTLSVSLDVGAGEVVAVLGPNGAGKTTLLRAIAGLTPVSDGEVTVDDVAWATPRHALPPDQRACGLLAADHLLFPHLSALDNVAFGPRARGRYATDAHDRARLELDQLGIGELADRRPHQLSHGQAQRVALARALATDPRVLLLDEPLAALDPESRPAIRHSLSQRLDAFAGMTVLVTHDPLDALTLADCLVFLREGAIVQEGPPEEIVRHPRDSYVAEVAGLNLYAGTARQSADETVVAVTGRLDIVAASGSAAPGTSGTCWVAFPPSAVSLYRSRPDGSPRNTWAGRVDSLELTGQTARVRVVGALDLVADITLASVASLQLHPGDEVWASVKATEVRCYPA